jgi:hypothetical protein
MAATPATTAMARTAHLRTWRRRARLLAARERGGVDVGVVEADTVGDSR